jgi:hypothetical protein
MRRFLYDEKIAADKMIAVQRENFEDSGYAFSRFSGGL